MYVELIMRAPAGADPSLTQLATGEMDLETTHGKNLADAAKAEGCKVFIWR